MYDILQLYNRYDIVYSNKRLSTSKKLFGEYTGQPLKWESP